ncbi:hypothetical protein [Mucilaginibacter polytrichastri]|uniref:Uncharacterized protein n=1 Tax=Mucilaginibacter polytrichastri TaxID=1302689 RepID=A0A1Q5ZW68_9SPHI|nr:hypothetical protein [Mucilaginibacter polytrichastri]OKS86012.1 hypothetical protein RG47T_1459 [Mucilaginibacter polytrichastri]SFS59712.1 hypothetical protein SAMN04487890_102125 [Mucilaginibacter polytrichastri]
MNYFPDPKHLLGLLQELLERIKNLSSYAYSESNAFALNVLNRQRHELIKALDLLGWSNDDDIVIQQSSTDNAILLCYRQKKTHTNRSVADFYKQGINGLQREVETFIEVVSRFLRK